MEKRNSRLIVPLSHLRVSLNQCLCGQIKETEPTYNNFDVIGRKDASLVSTLPSVPFCIDFFEKINNFSRCETQIIRLLCNTELVTHDELPQPRTHVTKGGEQSSI